MAPHPVQLEREKRGLTVAQLARLAGVSVHSIKRIESETWDKRTQISVAERIAEALGSTLGQLFDITHDLTHTGRPAGTGSPIERGRRVASIVKTEIYFTGLEPDETLCLSCFLVTRIGDECAHCGEPL